MRENLFKAIMDNKYKGDERQIKIRNSVFSKGFIGLCMSLILYSIAESVFNNFGGIQFNELLLPLSNPIVFIIGLCCLVMTFILCKKGAFFGYSNAVLVAGFFLLVPFGLIGITHHFFWNVFELPSFCNDWQFSILNISSNIILPLFVVLAQYFFLNMLYKRNLK